MSLPSKPSLTRLERAQWQQRADQLRRQMLGSLHLLFLAILVTSLSFDLLDQLVSRAMPGSISVLDLAKLAAFVALGLASPYLIARQMSMPVAPTILVVCGAGLVVVPQLFPEGVIPAHFIVGGVLGLIVCPALQGTVHLVTRPPVA